VTDKWIYQYGGSQRIGLRRVSDEGVKPKQLDLPDSKIIEFQKQLELPLVWEDVRTWGNPQLKPPQSDARYFHGDTYRLFKAIIGTEFTRTYALWKQKLLEAKTDETELLIVASLELEAMKLNIKNVQGYIAVRIECSERRIARLLELISIDRMQDEVINFADLHQSTYSIGEGSVSNWYPSKKEIEAKMAKIPRPCAAVLDNHCFDMLTHPKRFSGKLPICPSCHEKLADRSGVIEFWLLSEINTIRTTLRNEAIEACFEDHYGVMSVDELENYLDAS
jgi:hypothetical protein